MMKKENKTSNYKNFFRGKTILITGGLGFIGVNLAHALANLSPQKIIVVDALIDNLGGNSAQIPVLQQKGIEVIQENINNASRMKPLIAQADVIFNCAGSPKHTPFNEKYLEEDSQVNFSAQTKFLESCRQVMIEHPKKTIKIVFAGTRDQYGKVRYV